MILSKNESEITVLGDIQKYKVNIDKNNLQHIITILSSNLYSKPIQSFLREIVSNAVDSHTEAGTKEPIIITLADDSIAIRDFGTGISPERFHQTYINIGSSTKRNSNDFIGSFGIGKFSALAVSDIVNVTSFYNGKAYYYVMNKDVDQLHIDLVMEKDTNEQNGVEVKIPFYKTITLDHLEGVSYVKNIYIVDATSNSMYDGLVSIFNGRKIYKYNTFKILNYNYHYLNINKYTILVGNILYRVDYGGVMFNSPDSKKYRDWSDTFKSVCPQLNIGDVDVTPNREELLYSERTNKALKKAYDAAIEEITQLWYKKTQKEYTDFNEFIRTLTTHYTNRIKINETYLSVPNTLPYNIKLKEFPEYDIKRLKCIATVLLNTPINSIMYIDNGQIRKGEIIKRRTVKRFLENCTHLNTIYIAIPNQKGINSKYFKEFLIQKYSDKQYIYLLKDQQINYRKIIKDVRIPLQDKKIAIQLIRRLLKYIEPYVIRANIFDSAEYQQYKKEERKKLNKVSKYKTDDITYSIFVPKEMEQINKTRMKYKPHDIIYSLQRTYPRNRIVYTYVNSETLMKIQHLNYPHLTIIILSRSNYKLAKEGKLFPAYIKSLEEIWSEDNKILQKIATAQYILKQITIDKYKLIRRNTATFNTIFPIAISQKLKEILKYLRLYTNGIYLTLDSEIVSIKKYDSEAIELYNQLKKYIDLYCSIVYEFDNSNANLIWYILMKNKKIRIKYECYTTLNGIIKNLLNLTKGI